MRTWDAETGQPVVPPRKLGAFVSQAALSQNCRSVIPTCSAGALSESQVWAMDLTTGHRSVRAFEHDNAIVYAGFSPDGTRVVTTSSDHTARVWDADTCRPISPRLWHNGAVYHASFSPDGRLVATASEDETARVWDAATGEPATAPLKHRAAVHRVFFSPDGRWLLTMSVDGTVGVWALPKIGGPVEDELLLAELFAGHFVDETGAVLPVKPEAMQAAWVKVRERISREGETAQGHRSLVETEAGVQTNSLETVALPGRRAERLRAEDTNRKIEQASFVSSNDWVKVVSDCSKAIESEPDGWCGIYFSRAVAYEHLNRFRDAVRDLTEGLWIAPDRLMLSAAAGSFRAYTARARCFLALGEIEKAEADLQTMVELSPDDYKSYYQRALVYQQVGQLQKAMNDFSEAIKRSANQTNVLAQLYYLRGQNYVRLGENDKAEADFRKVPEYAPDDGEGCNNLAWYYATGPTNFRSPEKALPLALKAVELGKTNHNELNTLGVVYYRLGRLTNAITTLETGIKADTAGGSAYDFFFLAMSHQQLGDLAKAREYFVRGTNWVAAQTNLPPNDKAELDAFRTEAEDVLTKPKAK